ncbi:MAG: alpha/beta hydrolase [Chloroflexota bacterium]
MRKWIVAGGGTLAAVGGARALRGHRAQMRDLAGSLEARSKVADTAYGPIEYADFGDGPSLLVAHGIGGGYDQGMLVTRLTEDRPFRIISVSRFGYLRTPLGKYRSPEEQADAYAALLDTLGIEKVAVVGISAGGTSALLFALRHPERCWGLVMVAGVSQRLVPQLTRMERVFLSFLNRDISLWMMTSVAEDRLWSVYNITPEMRRKLAAQPEKLEVLRAILFSFPMDRRRAGFQNDMVNFPSIPIYPVERIAVPTMAVHGTADNVVPIAHSRFIADNVPGARLLTVEGAGHLAVVTHKEQVLPEVMNFLKDVAPE